MHTSYSITVNSHLSNKFHFHFKKLSFFVVFSLLSFSHWTKQRPHALSPSLSLPALLLVLSVFPHLHSVLVLKEKHRNHPLDFLSVSYQGRKYWSKVMMIYGCLVSRVYLNYMCMSWLFLKPATLDRDNNSFNFVTQYSFWTLISQKRTYLN